MKGFRIFFSFLLFFSFLTVEGQQITGVWKGKIDKKKVEVKIIKNGDSLTGTSYYYESPNNYRRYTIKGFFDEYDNSAVWWDDELIEEKGTRIFSKGAMPLLSVADFNCPGSGRMFLEGNSSTKENKTDIKGPVDLTKVGNTIFPDEWDFVIENYTVGGNDPYIIDSVALIAKSPKKPPVVEREISEPIARGPKKGMVSIPPPPQPKPSEPIASKPLTIEEKFIIRKKVFHSEIPVTGDSIELRFYDNAQVDGDSITLFLNDKLIFQHIRLTAKAYIIKLSIKDMDDVNELTMVAENLGTIPPNTSYMVAIVGDKRFEANLSSTEETSAVIRLKKPAENTGKSVSETNIKNL